METPCASAAAAAAFQCESRVRRGARQSSRLPTSASSSPMTSRWHSRCRNMPYTPQRCAGLPTPSPRCKAAPLLAWMLILRSPARTTCMAARRFRNSSRHFGLTVHCGVRGLRSGLWTSRVASAQQQRLAQVWAQAAPVVVRSIRKLPVEIFAAPLQGGRRMRMTCSKSTTRCRWPRRFAPVSLQRIFVGTRSGQRSTSLLLVLGSCGPGPLPARRCWRPIVERAGPQQPRALWSRMSWGAACWLSRCASMRPSWRTVLRLSFNQAPSTRRA
mmetsp:Transcript_35001/g.96815  ORF Transcript_35001/g.96815 Transcript_35001/m.96815 type:complete len:272 (-) Transcript_35001:400-1215(-)